MAGAGEETTVRIDKRAEVHNILLSTGTTGRHAAAFAHAVE